MSEGGFDTSLFYPPPDYPIPPKPELTAHQQTNLKTLEEHFGKEGYEILTEEHGSEKRRLSEREYMYLSRDTFLRFLTATKGDVHAAIDRIEGALIWRRTVSIDDVEKMAEDCSEESRCGKNIVMGFSPSRRPLMYFFPHRNIIPADQRRAVHAIFMLERARDLMPAGATSVIVVFNFGGKREGPPTSFAVARQILHILGSHYPETLSLSSFQNVPWVIKAFINLLWPFVDPATKKKVKFGSSEGQELIKDGDVEAGQLLVECGGNLNLPYDHDRYWPAMVETCLKLRKEQEEAFRALGPARVGIEEREWRGSEKGAVTNDTNASKPPVIGSTPRDAEKTSDKGDSLIAQPSDQVRSGENDVATNEKVPLEGIPPVEEPARTAVAA